MTTADCDHPANEALPFYLNGSLEGAEEASVREHVDACERCSRELHALSDVASAVRQRRIPILDDGVPRRSGAMTWGLAVAAALFLTVMTAVLLDRVGPPRSTPPVESGTGRSPSPVRVAVALDLGGGPTRDVTPLPRLILQGHEDAVSIRFVAPVTADAEQTLDLKDPTGAVIVRERVRLSRDALGRVTYVFPATLFKGSGRYTLGLRGETPPGAARVLEYPFLVEPPAAAPARP